jgi:hypothetical protein
MKACHFTETIFFRDKRTDGLTITVHKPVRLFPRHLSLAVSILGGLLNNHGEQHPIIDETLERHTALRSNFVMQPEGIILKHRTFEAHLTALTVNRFTGR